ncbi:MAG TPA: hypothetical protein VG122_08035 [Gemmata sp.]|jgi:hypothetical protein|nr:hypothetical protein [Gemmata sp.]
MPSRGKSNGVVLEESRVGLSSHHRDASFQTIDTTPDDAVRLFGQNAAAIVVVEAQRASKKWRSDVN